MFFIHNYSFIDLLAHSLIHSLAPLLARSLTHSLPPSLTHSLTHSHTHTYTHTHTNTHTHKQTCTCKWAAEREARGLKPPLMLLRGTKPPSKTEP